MIDSFRHAINGIIWSAKYHRNFRVHIAISLFVLLFAFIFKLGRIEFIILLFVILLGFTVEMINTAIEEITNLVTIKWAKQAKIAKDTGAGIVLLVAIGAIVIGLMIFTPYFIAAFVNYF